MAKKARTPTPPRKAVQAPKVRTGKAKAAAEPRPTWLYVFAAAGPIAVAAVLLIFFVFGRDTGAPNDSGLANTLAAAGCTLKRRRASSRSRTTRPCPPSTRRSSGTRTRRPTGPTTASGPSGTSTTSPSTPPGAPQRGARRDDHLVRPQHLAPDEAEAPQLLQRRSGRDARHPVRADGQEDRHDRLDGRHDQVLPEGRRQGRLRHRSSRGLPRLRSEGLYCLPGHVSRAGTEPYTDGGHIPASANPPGT